MKEKLTPEEKRQIISEHNDKILKTRIMLFVSFLFPLAIIAGLDKINDAYANYLFYGSWVVVLIPIIRLISLSSCPFCGYVDPRHAGKLKHFYSDHCPNCKEKIK